MDFIYIFVNNVIKFNFFFSFPVSIILRDKICDELKCMEVLDIYFWFNIRMFLLIFFYNNLLSYYTNKWGFNLSMETIDFLNSFFYCLLPIKIYYIFWMIFFRENVEDKIISFFLPLAILAYGIEINYRDIF